MKSLQKNQQITFIDKKLIINRGVDFTNYKIYATVQNIKNSTITLTINKITYPLYLMYEKTTYSDNLCKSITVNMSNINLMD